MSGLRGEDRSVQQDYGLLPAGPELDDGKQQEYKERKLYDPKNSVLKASKTRKKT